MGEQGEEGKEGDKKEGEQDKKTGGQKPGEKEYQVSDDGKRPDAEVGVERVVNDNIWEADKRIKEAQAARSGDEATDEPARYKDMWKDFSRAISRLGVEKESTETSTEASDANDEGSGDE